MTNNNTWVEQPSEQNHGEDRVLVAQRGEEDTLSAINSAHWGKIRIYHHVLRLLEIAENRPKEDR